jgi:uncharacterized protein
MKKVNQFIPVFFTALFPFILLAYEYKLYRIFLVLYLFQLLAIINLTTEKARLLLWSLNTLLFCFLVILYGYPLIEGMPLTRKSIILLGESLQLLPIILLLYFHMMFHQKVEFNFGKMQSVHPLLKYIFIGMPFSILLFLNLTDGRHEINWLFMYGLLHAVLLEVLWRGILLPLYVEILGVFTGILINCITFGFYLQSLGFPVYLCMIMAIVSITSSIARLKTSSISPAIFIHYMTIILLFFIGFFVPPI